MSAIFIYVAQVNEPKKRIVMSEETTQALDNLKNNVLDLHNLLARDYAFLSNAELPGQFKSFLSRVHEYSEYFKGAFIDLRQDSNSIHLEHLNKACKEFMHELDHNIKQLQSWPDSNPAIFKNQMSRLFYELKNLAFNMSVAQKIMHSDKKSRQRQSNEHLLIVEHQILAMEQLMKKHSYLFDSPHTTDNLRKALQMVPHFVGKQRSALKSKDISNLLMSAERFLNGLDSAIKTYPENVSDSLEDQRKKEAYTLFLHLKGRTSFLIKAASTAMFNS